MSLKMLGALFALTLTVFASSAYAQSDSDFGTLADVGDRPMPVPTAQPQPQPPSSVVRAQYAGRTTPSGYVRPQPPQGADPARFVCYRGNHRFEGLQLCTLDTVWGGQGYVRREVNVHYFAYNRTGAFVGHVINEQLIGSQQAALVVSATPAYEESYDAPQPYYGPPAYSYQRSYYGSGYYRERPWSRCATEPVVPGGGGLQRRNCS